MSVEYVMEFAGVDAAKYDEAMRALGLDGPDADWPRGLLSHTAGATDDGWCVVDVWESDEEFERFATQALGPTLGRIGIPAPQPRRVEVHNWHVDNASGRHLIADIYGVINTGDYTRVAELISPDYV